MEGYPGVDRVIGKGSKWVARSGIKTLFWDDPWVLGEPLIAESISAPGTSLLNCPVQDF